jgi:ferredoxin-NADP reductase
MSNVQILEVRVKSITYEAQGISSYDLRALSGSELPPFTAGAHIDLHLPNGLIRSYSLVNPQVESDRYVIAVNRDAATRGGSRYMHEAVRPGDTLTIAAPRNNFPLVEQASQTVFIAGGIGITPLWCMIQRLEAVGRPWELYYGARSRQNAAFLDNLRALDEPAHRRLHLNFDQEAGGRMLDIASVVERTTPDTHLYCCGPIPMLTAFEQATASRPSEYVHVEYFSAREPPAAGGFTVVLARSARTFAVPPGKSILDTLLEHGIDVPHSCKEGVCGTCETTVIEGIPDHRDLVLSKAEQAANTTMMICCSGCKGEKLVLDL